MVFIIILRKKNKKTNKNKSFLGKKIKFMGSDKMFFEQAEALKIKITSSKGFKRKFNISNLDLVQQENQEIPLIENSNEKEFTGKIYNTKNILKLAEIRFNEIIFGRIRK